MKTSIKFFTALLVLNLASWSAPDKSSAQVAVSFQLFYDDLSPYGQWVDYPEYGNVWIPSVGAGFSPYATAGHWVFTEYGWTWVSDYPWGWAPFHYGRWNYDPYVGWLWVPGREWGPAWVSWRRAPGYYGWAPLGYGRDYDHDNDRWVFVKGGDIDRNDINRYYLDRSNNSSIMGQSEPLDNKRNDEARHVSYNAGPDVNEVRKSTGRDIKPLPLRDNDKPGQKVDNAEVRMFRPEVKSESPNGAKPAPAKVISVNEAKTMRERNMDNRDNQNAPGNQKGQPVNGNQEVHPQTQPRDINNNNQNRPEEARPKQDNPDNNNRMNQPPQAKPDNGNMQPEPKRENPNDNNPNQQPEPKRENPNDNNPNQQPRDLNQQPETHQDNPADHPAQSPQVNPQKDNNVAPAKPQSDRKTRRNAAKRPK